MHRFIISRLKEGRMKITEPALLWQWQNVLCLKKGEIIIVSDGKNREAEARLESIGKNLTVIRISPPRASFCEPEREVTLYCAVLKKDNFEWLAQKATEVGVSRIVPLLTTRTVKTNLNFSRLKKIVKEAAEQAGRGREPQLGKIASLSDAWRTDQSDSQIFFDPTGKILTSFHSPVAKKISLYVGPEGGWTKEEIKIAAKSGKKIFNLGKTILRAETAAIVGSFWAVNGL